MTKGFKVGRECSLCLNDPAYQYSSKRLADSRTDTKLTEHTKCLITYVDTSSLVIELRINVKLFLGLFMKLSLVMIEKPSCTWRKTSRIYNGKTS